MLKKLYREKVYFIFFISGLCTAIDDFVTNPAMRPTLPVDQLPSKSFTIPSQVTKITPTSLAEMLERRNRSYNNQKISKSITIEYTDEQLSFRN